MSATYGDTALRKMLQGRLESEMEDRSKELVKGMASDYADYVGRCEYIAGLEAALSHLQAAFTEMNGDSRVRGR